MPKAKILIVLDYFYEVRNCMYTVHIYLTSAIFPLIASVLYKRTLPLDLSKTSFPKLFNIFLLNEMHIGPDARRYSVMIGFSICSPFPSSPIIFSKNENTMLRDLHDKIGNKKEN